jgi:hypothetical protein
VWWVSAHLPSAFRLGFDPQCPPMPSAVRMWEECGERSIVHLKFGASETGGIKEGRKEEEWECGELVGGGEYQMSETLALLYQVTCEALKKLNGTTVPI